MYPNLKEMKQRGENKKGELTFDFGEKRGPFINDGCDCISSPTRAVQGSSKGPLLAVGGVCFIGRGDVSRDL